MTDRQPSDFRFTIQPLPAAPAHDALSPAVIDAVDGRVVATFDAKERAVAVAEALEAAHDVGVAMRAALAQPTDAVPLEKVGDVLREGCAGVMAMVAKTEREHADTYKAYRAALVTASRHDERAHDEKGRADDLADKWRRACEDLAAEKARADDLSRTVAAMGEVLERVRHEVDMVTDGHDNPRRDVRHGDGRPVGHAEWKEPFRGAADAARAILSRPDVTAERGRWRKVDEVIAALTKAGLALGVHSTMDLDAHIKRVREDFDAISADRDAAIARVATLTTLAEKVDAIRNGIVGMQGFHFSEHGYPLVAALEEAGFRGVGYEVARKNLGTIIEQRDAAERSRDEAVRRAESAELGCDIAYRREPTQEEGDAHEDKQHQSMGPDLATGECFVAMGGWTGRRCRHCARWVWGGPTACAVCVERASRDELGIQLAAQSERLRLAMAVVDAADLVREHCIVSGRDRSSGHDEILSTYDDAYDAFHAVPGDALAKAVSPNCPRPIDCGLDGFHAADECVGPVPPTSPAGVSGQPSGSTPAASSVTSSSSEVEANPSAQSGTRDPWEHNPGARPMPHPGAPSGLRAVAVSHLEALGIDTSNVKEKA